MHISGYDDTINISSNYRGFGMKKARWIIISSILIICTAVCLTGLLMSFKGLKSEDSGKLSSDSEYRVSKKKAEKLFKKISFPEDDDFSFYYGLYSVDYRDFTDPEVFSLISDASALKNIRSSLEKDSDYDTVFFDSSVVSEAPLSKAMLSKILDYEAAAYDAEALSLLWADIHGITVSTPVDLLEFVKISSYLDNTGTDKLKLLSDINASPYMNIEDAAEFFKLDKDILSYFYTVDRGPSDSVIKMTLPELADYLRSDIIDNPEFEDLIDDELRSDLLRFIKFADKNLYDKNMDADDLSELLETDKGTVTAVLLLKNPFGAKKSKLPDFVDFVIDNVAENPLLSDYVDDQTMYQLKLLRTVIDYTKRDKRLDYNETAELFGIDTSLTKMLYQKKENPSGKNEETDGKMTRNIIVILSDLVSNASEADISEEKLSELKKLSDAFSLINKGSLSPEELSVLLCTDLGLTDESTLYRRLLLNEKTPDSIKTDDFLKLSKPEVTENTLYITASDYILKILSGFVKDEEYRMFVGIKGGTEKKDADELFKEIKQSTDDKDLTVSLCSRSLLRKDIDKKYTFMIRLFGILLIILLPCTVFSIIKTIRK